jgi:hypothetical protein
MYIEFYNHNNNNRSFFVFVNGLQRLSIDLPYFQDQI